MTDKYQALRDGMPELQREAALEGAAGIMPRPIVTDAQRCAYRCPYYMDGPVLSICKLDGKPLRYDGIPPLRNEKCKSTPSPTQTGEQQ